MTNQNTPEYMDKIKTRLFENLRMLPHAPGVQMANIPEDGVTLKEESENADEADPDKRNPQQIKDKSIEPDNEFEDPKSGNRDNSESAKGDVKKEESKEEAMEVDEHKPADTKSPTKEAAAAST